MLDVGTGGGFPGIPLSIFEYTFTATLENRFDKRVRTLTASLFLVQRGLAAGITIYHFKLSLKSAGNHTKSKTAIIIPST